MSAKKKSKHDKGTPKRRSIARRSVPVSLPPISELSGIAPAHEPRPPKPVVPAPEPTDDEVTQPRAPKPRRTRGGA